MNKDIVSAVETQLGNAQDNLHRARAAFRDCSAADLAGQYGQSGSTRAQILEEYTQEVARWQAALAEAKAKP